METYTFWRERETRFLELTRLSGAAQLHATRVEVDVPAELERASERTRAAIADPSVALESVYGHARLAARAGRILLNGEQADRWIVSGELHDRLARETLKNTFRAEAMIAAVGAGEVGAATGEQAAVEAWLDLIVREKSPHWRNFGVLEHLAHASVEACGRLAARAYRAAAPDPSETVGDRIDRLRNECGLTIEGLAEKVRLDRSSVLDHTSNRTKPRRKNLQHYRDVFSLALGRKLRVEDLRDE